MPGRHRGGQRRRQAADAVDRNAVAAVFGKTKLCKFHILGMCMKGTACGFAHAPEEMRSLPDLSCTKFCKSLINTGVCDDPQCKYAHNKEELRASSQVPFGHGQVLLPPDVLQVLVEPTASRPADVAQANQENVHPMQQGWSSPSCFFEQTASGQLRRAMKSFGSNLALIQEEADVDESDDEKPLDHASDPRLEPYDSNFLPLGELTVKNTFLDIAAPDEPVKLGLRTVKTAGGRLDGLARLDSDDDDEWAH
jgi:hypothetical protein